MICRIRAIRAIRTIRISTKPRGHLNAACRRSFGQPPLRAAKQGVIDCVERHEKRIAPISRIRQSIAARRWTDKTKNRRCFLHACHLSRHSGSLHGGIAST